MLVRLNLCPNAQLLLSNRRLAYYKRPANHFWSASHSVTCSAVVTGIMAFPKQEENGIHTGLFRVSCI